jgi:hypothetical protein
VKLFHFLSAQNAISDIALKRIKISRIGQLNDPFEFLAVDLADAWKKAALENWKNDLDEKFGLICFCANWSNPLMWGHYADSHKGIALCVEITDETASDVLLGVDYTKDRARIAFDPDARSVVGGKDTVNRLLRTKFIDWQYEQEYRFFIGLESSQKEGSNYFADFSEQLVLSEVILGFKCDFRIEQIRELIGSNYANVRVRKAGLHQQVFEVIEN